MAVTCERCLSGRHVRCGGRGGCGCADCRRTTATRRRAARPTPRPRPKRPPKQRQLRTTPSGYALGNTEDEVRQAVLTLVRNLERRTHRRTHTP